MTKDFVLRLLRQIIGVLSLYNNVPWKKIPDLTLAQISLLNEIFDLTDMSHDQLSLSELSIAIGSSKATVCSMLKTLKRAGYIHMDTDLKDNRRKIILITDKALTAKADIKQCISQANDTICQGISEHDLQVTQQALKTMTANAKKSWSPAGNNEKSSI